MSNLGNLSYVAIAAAGGALAVSGLGGFTLGSLASFLQFNRSFNQPITQISQQFNSIIMALAGAQRVFRLLDETHSGYLSCWISSRSRTRDNTSW